MLHLATVHWKDDRWIDIQRRYLQAHIQVPYRVYAFLNDLPGEHRAKFHYSCTEPIKSHAIKLNLLAEIIACSRGTSPNDWLIFLDGDAFPIGDIVSFGREKLAEYPLLAVQRLENDNDIQPHPCFCLTTVGFWQEIGGDWKEGYRWRGPRGDMVTDVGGNLLGILERKQIAWYPMLRSNKKNPDPVFFGIYEDLVYHHGAGFRAGVSRAARSELRAEVEGNLLYRIAGAIAARYPKTGRFAQGRLRAIGERIDPERWIRKRVRRDSGRTLQAVYESIRDDMHFYQQFQ